MARPSDDRALFELFAAAVPPRARAAEALTFEEWRALREPTAWWRLPGRRHTGVVWELGGELIGHCRIRREGATRTFRLLVHPRFEDATERLLEHVLTLCRGKEPLATTAREYQVTLARALEARGFAADERRELYVRMLAQRVPETRLAAARMAVA